MSNISRFFYPISTRAVLAIICFFPPPATSGVELKYASNSGYIWFADMESGDLSQWSTSSLQPTPCGGQFNSAGGFSVPSRDFARSGNWSIRMTISGDSDASETAGTRMHRWCESQRYRELYYSVWYYVPQLYTVREGGWQNWFQFKSRPAQGKLVDPIFFLDVRNEPASKSMRFLLSWWSGLTIEGPSPGQHGYRSWRSSQDIPIGRWFNVTTRYVCSGDFDGAIQVWQDDVEIFNLSGVRTRHIEGDCQWGVNNYGRKISPSPVVIYIDDATISTRRSMSK